MIKKILCIKDYQDRSLTGSTWPTLSGITDNGDVVYYTGQTGETNAYLVRIAIHIRQSVDDMGFFTPTEEEYVSGNHYTPGQTVINSGYTYLNITTASGDTFDEGEWVKTPTGFTDITGVTFLGESKIKEFRRYGKTDADVDLYNPTWNTGYTFETKTTDGKVKKITGQRISNELTNRNVYDYVIGDIQYSDLNENQSLITYKPSGQTNENSISLQNIKLDYLLGVINPPKINIDVFIDRGNNSAFEKHMKLGDIRSYNGMLGYGGGYFKIKED